MVLGVVSEGISESALSARLYTIFLEQEPTVPLNESEGITQ